MAKAGRRRTRKNPDHVFTFRLNADIEIEALALSVMDKWREEDENITPRQMIAQALALIAGYELDQPEPPPVGEPQPDLTEFIYSFQEEIAELRSVIAELRSSGIRVNTQAADVVASNIQTNLPQAYLKTLSGRVNRGNKS